MKQAATKSSAKGQKRKRPAVDSARTGVEGTALPQTAAPARDPATPATVVLTGSCTVKDAVAIRQSLMAVADSAAPVVIDASGIERIDTAIIQLLYVFVRDRLASDREVLWQAPSASLTEAAQLLGIRDLLNLPRAEAA